MNPHTFRLRLEWREGTTAGDRNAMITAFNREIVQVYGLDARDIPHASAAAHEVVYGFRERVSADAMHDVCRAIFRFLRRRRELHGIGISDRTWWTPRFDPVLDTVEPLLDAMTEPL